MPERVKILIADDNEEFRENLKDIVELKGFDVVTAANGAEAVVRARADCPGVIIMDIRMPVMDGVAAFRQIKEICPDAHVILVTAFAADDVIEGALRDGAFGILRKPVDFDELFRIVKNASSGGRLVLVVDDNKELTMNLRDVLDAKGYRTVVSYDGREALARAQENKFDIIIMDMKLPYINGLDAYLAIRQVRPEAVVVVVTGYPKEMGALAGKAVEQSAYAWIEKPFDMDRLLALLDRINKQKAEGKLEKPGEPF